MDLICKQFYIMHPNICEPAGQFYSCNLDNGSFFILLPSVADILHLGIAVL